jgi:hypothetical protein
MKYNGEPIIRQYTTLKLTTGIEVKVFTTPIGVVKDFDAIWAEPTPPATTVNAVGKAPVTSRNYEDPAFLKAYTEREYHKRIYVAYRLIKDDTRVQFDNIPTDEASTKALAKEFAASGLSEGDITKLIEIADKLSYISDEELKKADKSF